MNGFELTLIALALSLDVFAAAVCKGTKMRRLDLRYVGIFLLATVPIQIMMAVLGNLFGAKIAPHLTSFEHWILLLLFAVIGTNMIGEGRKDPAKSVLRYGEDSVLENLLASVVFGVNVFAAGISFPLLSVDISPALILVAVTTVVMSVLGFAAGHLFGAEKSGGAVITGGTLLVIVGVEIALRQMIFS